MKKTVKTLLGLGAAALLLAACSSTSTSQSSSDATTKVGILQYVEHESLSAARKGFIDELAKSGYQEGDAITIDYQNAQADQANLQTISEKLVAQNDLVLGIATPAAQSLAQASTDTPILFTAVTDPVSAELVKSMDKPEGQLTGTSDRSPIDKQIQLLLAVKPDLKKVGILYTTSERNSEVQVEAAKEMFKTAGIDVVAKGISSTNDVQDAARSLMSQTQAVFVPTDNTIASSIAILKELSLDLKIPVIGGSADMVAEGLLMTYGPDFEALGRQTAKMAVKVLEGKKPADLAVEYPEALKVAINEEVAKSLGIDTSQLLD